MVALWVVVVCVRIVAFQVRLSGTAANFVFDTGFALGLDEKREAPTGVEGSRPAGASHLSV